MSENFPVSHLPAHWSATWLPVAPEYKPAAHSTHSALDVKPVEPLPCLPAEQRPTHSMSELKPVATLHFPDEQAPVHFDASMLPVDASTWNFPTTQ